jgi:hypothetical protein
LQGSIIIPLKTQKGYTPVKSGLVSVSSGMLIYIGLFSFLPFSINCIGDSEENWVRIRNFDLVHETHEYEQTLTDEDGDTYTENKSFQEDAIKFKYKEYEFSYFCKLYDVEELVIVVKTGFFGWEYIDRLEFPDSD